MTRTLSEITSELRSLLFVLEDQAGELDENLEASLDDCEGELKDKINSLLSACDDMTAKAGVYKGRAAKFTEAQKRLESRVERIKTWVVQNMQAVGLTKFGTENYPSIGLRKSKAVAIDENLFVITACERPELTTEIPATWKPNKKAIKEALQSGELITGASLRTNHNLKY